MDLSGLVWMIPTSLLAWITYRYLSAPAKRWEEQGIPSVPPWKFVTGIIELFFTPIHETLVNNYRKYGKMSVQYILGNFTLMVSDPDMMRTILVKDFQNFVDRMDFGSGDPIVENMLTALKGEKWKRIRAIMSPTFSTGKIKKMSDSVLQSADTLRKNFEKNAETNEPADIKKLSGAFAMDTIASTAFSTKVDSHNDPENLFVVAANQVFSRRSQWKMIIIVTFSKLLKLLRIKISNLMSTHFFEKLAARIIEQRRKNPDQKRNDFLQLMLNASEKSRLDAISNTENDQANGSIKEKVEEVDDEKFEDKLKEFKGLTDTEIIAQCVIFFVGGFETVASTVSFALYELALNEEYQETLIAEIDDALRRNKNELRYEDVQEMKFLDCVVSEVLRKYPPGIVLQRMAINDCVVGDKNIKIPKGTLVSFPVYALHYDPEYFPDPEKFDPNRFTQEAKASRNPYVYLPFGAGPRNCIAMRFALTEVKLCLAHLLRHLRFRRCSSTRVPMTFGIGQVQLLAKNIFLSVEKRKDAVISTSD